MGKKRKPKYLTPELQGIPQELIEKDQWVCWQAEFRDGKWTKVPYNARTLERASSTDESTWSDFKTTWATYSSNNRLFDGVGFVLKKGGGIVGVDVDHFKDHPELAPIIDTLQTFTEHSPSYEGLRAFFFGELPPGGRKKGDFELYDSGRFLTVTGWKVDGAPSYMRRVAAEVVAEIHRQVFGEPVKPTQEPQLDGTSTLPDDEVKARIRANPKQAAKFSRLFDVGNWEGYASQSEADLALCGMLAFWCGRDAAQVDRLFRQSGLFREKWDERHGDRGTYGEITIQKALADCVECYRPTASRDGEITLSEVKTALAQNEDGDADIFIRLYRDRLVYDHAARCWYCYAGHFYTLDKTDQATASVDGVITTYMREHALISAQKQQLILAGEAEAAKAKQTDLNSIEKRVFQLHKKERKGNVVHLARTGSGSLGITGEEWDREAWVLGCANGVLDLRTGVLRPGRPSDYIRTAAPTEFAGLDAPCPTWERFLREIMGSDMEMVDYLQRLLGYSTLGEAIEHIIAILWGAGRNGKGTLLETLGTVLGPLAQKAESELMLRQKQPRQAGAPNSAVSALRGRRMVWASEVGEGRAFDVARVKELVGGDTLSAREPYARRNVEFKPTHTLFLLTNTKPAATAEDYAFWKRVHLIPFRVSFVDDPRAQHERQADKFLKDKLLAERSGILAWLVRGCLEWQRLGGLQPPDIVKAAVEDYRAEEDVVGAYLDECCEFDDVSKARASELYQAYSEWCLDNGYKPFSKKRWGTAMHQKPGVDSYHSGGTWYTGVRLKA